MLTFFRWSLVQLILSAPALAAPMQDRLVWLFDLDLEKPADVDRAEKVLTAGAAHGINGAVLSIELKGLADESGGSHDGLARVMKTCEALKVELIPAAFSFGYGGPFLGRNRNLAEGLQVKDALFVAGPDGRARFTADPPVRIENGGFEEHQGDRFAKFGFHDAPGVISFADTAIRHGGATSIRLTNFASDPHGHGRVHVEVSVHPDRCYRVTLWAKSQALGPKDGFHVEVLAPGEGERALSHKSFDLPPTSDWTKCSLLFNSRGEAKAELYAGVWEGKSGTLWLDDLSMEEVGPVNPLRRPGTPVVVKGDPSTGLRAGDGVTYEEGKDFARLEDPELHPWSDDKPALDLTLLPGGRIKPGTRLRVSWYHPMIVYHGQVGVCMAEPQIYDIVDEEARALVARLHPRRILLNMDEIRFGGTCDACRGKDMARLLGDSVSRIAAILRKYDPAIGLYCWSDMFDPNVNAHGNYYFVNGDYTGSWKYLPKDITMAVWGGDAMPRSFAFFAEQGFKVLGACYYDADDLKSSKEWVELARKYPNVRGLMYTTWEGKYDLLPGFGDLLKE